MLKLKVCDAPGANKPVLANAFSSEAGLSNLVAGALIDNSATSLPATVPVFVIVTLA
jgi:hypothetical protein